ncbi:Serine/threonine-protein kinase ppk30 [Cytospora mali]|uniref:non-specific serine/threonine protein kinase n=1 Tax=Cytospora mali TaxID=578113 RepID=A0A194UX40_CYTMA|nr:Serine/threonine-protein kinase ppk30 [Valsa mali var. pyri (nom. inval.)]
MPQPVDGTDLAVLKRVAVPDKDALRGMRTEVETMKRLKGHRPIVTYIDSHASELKGGGYEVFLLMEYCNGGGLIDFMNTRLQHRLTEPEILQIFTDVAEGVACMHYLKPPLLHRDLKVENVLFISTGSKKKFKLCDFGSAAAPRPAPTTVVECRLVDEDVQKHTTMQYRSPEMVDVYRKQPIDEKSDIWALGVLLYKLCYYTTPFEEQGQLAILNASYRFPSYPAFSDRLKKLIASMLKETPQARPNIYQVLKESCAMQGRDIPITDIYAGKSPSESHAPRQDNPKVVGAVFSPPPQQETVIPDIAPMRRGRLPAASAQPAAPSTKPTPSPMRINNGDPFAALDSAAGIKTVDELSNKFPTLDQFSILHEKGVKFDFEGQDPSLAGQPGQSAEIGRGARMPSTSPERQTVLPSVKSASAPPRPAEMSRASSIIKNTPELQAISSGSAQAFQPSPARPTMVSTGTMTTPPPERQPSATPSQYPVYRFPTADHHRSSSLGRQEANISLPIRTDSPSLRPTASPRIPSFQGHARQPSSSRPSLEGGRPSMETLEPMHKTRSMSGRTRPASTYLESNLDFLREQEKNSKPLASPGLPPAASSDLLSDEEMNIESNVDFLRSMEESQPRKSVEGKRSSLTSLGKKSIFAGKFGDAFKRFEVSQPGGAPQGRTPSPFKPLDRNDLTPITGSEATDGRSDDGQPLGDTDEITPEMRREIEQRQLEEEERRVVAAQAEYRARLAQRGEGGKPTPPPVGGSSRAISIQSKVQSLLDENARSSTNVKRTAEGYGQYTEPAAGSAQSIDSRPEVPRKPLVTGRGSTSTPRPMSSSNSLNQATTGADSSRPIPPPKDIGNKPMAPPKPKTLTGSSISSSPPKIAAINTTGMRQTGRLEALVAADLPGQPALDMTAQEKDDYLRDFSKRFPSLTSIEMVERDLAAEENSRPGR